MKNRGVIMDKELMAQRVMKIAKQSKSLDDLEKKLHEHNIECYRRKNVLTGCWYGKRKFRFTTLGVGKIHLKKLTREQGRLNELQRKKDKQKNRKKGRER